MAIAKLDQNSEFLTRFNAFVTAAKGAGKDDVFVRDEDQGQQFALRQSAEDKIGKFRRSESLKQANDNVRQAFKDTVLHMLGKDDVNELDEDVRAALQLDDYGKGKPLSARRILAVNAVIQKKIALNVNDDFVAGETADTQNKIRNSIAKGDPEALFQQTCGDVFRAQERRPTEDEVRMFRDNPYAKVDLGGPGQLYLLNGNSFPAPASEGDTAGIKKFAYSFLAEGLPQGRLIPRLANSDLNLQVGEFLPMKDLIAEGLTPETLADKLLGTAASRAKTAFIDKLNGLPGVLGGGIVATEQGLKLVTKQERELHQAMLYFCQQSTMSFCAKFFPLHHDPFGGIARHSQRNEQSTLNVVRSNDGPGYDIITRIKAPLDSVTDLNDAVTVYDPLHPPTVDFDVVFHVGWSEEGGGSPTVTARQGDHAPRVTLSAAEPISRAELTSRMQQIVGQDGEELYKDKPLARKWFSSLPKSERKAIQDDVVRNLVDDAFQGMRVELSVASANLLPWMANRWVEAHDKLAAFEQFAAAHSNSGDFYVRKSSADGVQFESAGTRNALRTTASKKENNEIRRNLKDYVYAYYHGDVPESVLAEMTNFDGEGHPLSAKRISRICAAIKQERVDRLSEMEFQPGKSIGEIGGVSPALADVVEGLSERQHLRPAGKQRLAQLMVIATNPNLHLSLDPSHQGDFLTRLGLDNLAVNDHDDVVIPRLAAKIKELTGGTQQLTLETAQGEHYAVILSDNGDIVPAEV